MSQESPRMVTTINHWSAFPTSVFTGGGIIDPQLHPTTTTVTSKEKNTTANNNRGNLVCEKTMPLLPGEGQTSKTHILPRCRVAGKDGTIANKIRHNIINNVNDTRNCRRCTTTTKDTTTLCTSTNAINGGGGDANITNTNHTKLPTSTTSFRTGLSLLTLAEASLQHQQQMQQRLALSSLMLPEMVLAADNSSNIGSSAVEDATGTRRSRAIAIKRPSASSRTDASLTSIDGEQPVSASAERMYDWATWRMYERITEHRRRYPIKRSYYHESPSASSSSTRGNEGYDEDDEPEAGGEGRDQVDDKGLCTVGSRRSLVTPVDEERFFDGEIFELEI